MKTVTYKDKESWLEARRGKLTGSRLKDIIVKRGTGKKIGFYELIAERIAIPPDEEDVMERGNRLEKEAIERFSEETGKKVNTDLVMWMREDDDSIAVSPDGFMGKTEALEVKCLSSARHLEAFLTQQVPSEYEYQVLQYFIVNDKLKTLFLAFYDPRIPSKDFFYLTITRESLEEQIQFVLDYERETLKEVNEVVSSLTF